MSLSLFAGEFSFDGYAIEGHGIELRYSVQGKERFQFCERLSFPGAPALSSLSPERQAALQQALKLLHVIAGVSYYKTLVPPVLKAHALDAELVALSREVYVHGLGEFAHHNGIALNPMFELKPDASPVAAVNCELEHRALVAIGGGKDSLVSIETLKAAGSPACAVWIGNSELIAATAHATGLPCLNIERSVDPGLFALNQRGALNGHVPVTAINSCILAVAAIWYGYQQIVFSNEASANSPTLQHDGKPINHQWSKSFAFEAQFARYLQRYVATDLAYFSLLRPYHELAITAAFAKTTQYDALFSSCNRNFRILGAKPAQRWCGVCPKCHFVFLALAPFVGKPRLLAIFGRNLLDDPEQAPGFDALLEFDGAHKPFECVGDAAESRAALAHLAMRADWQEDALVQRFIKFQQPVLGELLSLDALKQPSGAHLVPVSLMPVLEERMR